MSKQAIFIASDKYRHHSYGDMHPLGIPRVSLTYDLIKACNAILENEFLESAKATNDQLLWFHTQDYINAMQASESAGRVLADYRKCHNLGNFENPYFPQFFSTPATAAGGSIQAAEEVLKGNIAFSPAGGMHHAMPNEAHGFCFFNDPVLAIMRLKQAGKKVLYIDIDAHHGDGVEYAFRNDGDVSTFSLHMDTCYAYPFKGGGIEDTGALFNAFNVPLPKGCNDSEYAYVFDNLWHEVLQVVAPDAVVLQAGTDILMPDPLGKFNISTQQFLNVVKKIKSTAPNSALAVLGGGGYHPLSLARCWLGVWAVLSERNLPMELPTAASELLQAVEWDLDEDEAYFAQLFHSRLDPDLSGNIRDEVKMIVDQILTFHPMLGKNVMQDTAYV